MQDGRPTPNVSVIIPVFNAAAFVRRAVESALTQEGAGELEVVAVNDCSTDATPRVLAELAASEPRLRVLTNEVNSGAAVSRNRACAAARGRWIAVLDADDAYRPDRLARLLEVAEGERLDVIADLPLLHDLAADELAEEQLSASGELEILGLPALLGAPEARGQPALDYGLLKPVFRRELVESGDWRYPDEARHGQDFLAYFDCLVAGRRYGVLHEAMYVFSTRIGERSGRYSPGSVTPVNYRAIAANTETLIERVRRDKIRPEGMEQDELIGLLKERIKRLDWLNRAYGWNTLRKGAWRRHWKWLRQDSRNPGLLLEMTGKKLSAQLGLKRPS